ncbi:MAG: helix-turn-helix transcriptional regulator [Saprospirales bacterium]|nr:helix-turn-helix transcriptional regulator [Saprospirales bacterium]
MERLVFERRKYGKELLIDACNVEELDIVNDTLVLSFYTIILLEKATGLYHLDTETIPLQDHTILFVKPGQFNKVGGAHFAHGHFLFFEGDFLDEFFNDKNFIYKFGFYHSPETPSVLRLGLSEFAKYDSIAAEIREEIRHLSADSHHVLRSLIYYLLVRLNQHYGKFYGSSPDTIMEPRVLQFIKLLEREIRTTQTVQAYADRLQISRVYLNQLCQKNFSKPSIQVIREYLLSEIKKEIKFSEKDLSEIAYDFNFSAPSHFTRFFKQMAHLTPQQYREGS